mgnify:CR=1 FL=1
MDATLIPVVAIIMGTLCFLVPVSLVTLRFAIKPIAEAVAQMRSVGASQQEIALMGQRLALLEQLADHPDPRRLALQVCGAALEREAQIVLSIPVAEHRLHRREVESESRLQVHEALGDHEVVALGVRLGCAVRGHFLVWPLFWIGP